MRKGKNEFVNKFQLLNSQENSQEIIIWSSSDSSDYENIFSTERIENKKHELNSRKRKRINRSSKSLKNISNLDITYVDNINDIKEINNTSPIINRNVTKCLSPILFLSQQQKIEKSADYNEHHTKSPILSFTQGFNPNKNMKSPILISKCKSPKYSPKIRKTLFNKTHNEVYLNYNNFAFNNDNCIVHATDCTRIEGELMLSHSKNKQKMETNILNNSVEMINEKINKDLVKTVKSYFDNHFSLTTNSQNSISEYESTPKSTSKTSEEIDIISSEDSDNSNIELISKATDKDDVKNTKAFKYKKDGMVYRLHKLLKKQNASISLWEHEKFLANSSKFVIPKGDYTAFRIINVQFKYGCYTIKSRDVNDDSYFIIINSIYVSNAVIEANMLLKLYKPFRLLTVKDCKLIVNAFKFECDIMNRI